MKTNNLLFFDVETTGLPKNYKASMADLNNWPRIVQIAYQYIDSPAILFETSDIIYPDGYEIPKESSDIHRITNEIALEKGIPIKESLEHFNKYVKKADLLIAHNIDFDYKVVGSEYLRCEIPVNYFVMLKRLCTMKSTIQFCDIPGKYGAKWPKLSELYFKLFEEDFSDAHDASSDVEAMVKCYFELKEKGILD